MNEVGKQHLNEIIYKRNGTKLNTLSALESHFNQKCHIGCLEIGFGLLRDFESRSHHLKPTSCSGGQRTSDVVDLELVHVQISHEASWVILVHTQSHPHQPHRIVQRVKGQNEMNFSSLKGGSTEM